MLNGRIYHPTRIFRLQLGERLTDSYLQPRRRHGHTMQQNCTRLCMRAIGLQSSVRIISNFSATHALTCPHDRREHMRKKKSDEFQ